MSKKDKTLDFEFQELDTRRSNKLERARECAELTIPGLLPEIGQTGEMELPVPYSSIGAQGVTSLAAKITSAIFPMNNQPFFEFDISQLEDDPATQSDPKLYYNTLKELHSYENRIHDRFTSSNYRSALYVAAQHLITIGDCLFHITDEFTFQVFRLDHYVLKRHPDGRVACIILREWIDPSLMDEDEMAKFPQKSGDKDTPSSYDANHPGLEPHYTKIEYDADEERWYVCKEFRDVKYDTDKYYEVLPYLPLRWSEISGEDYGRSLCEEQIGNLRSVESLSKSLVEGAAAMAEYRMGVRPSGTAKVTDLSDTENGAYVPADPEDVFPIHAELQSQVQAVMAAKMEMERALGRSFLMDSVTQPVGDRVTAYQSSVFSGEIEKALSGPFSSLSRDVELPVTLRAIEMMQQKGELPKSFSKLLSEGVIKLRIRTGLEALSKEVNASKLQALAQMMLALPEPAQRIVKWDGFLRDLWLNTGLDPTLSIMSPDEQEQMEQKAMAQQAQMAAAQQAIQSSGRIAEQQAQAQG